MRDKKTILETIRPNYKDSTDSDIFYSILEVLCDVRDVLNNILNRGIEVTTHTSRNIYNAGPR